MSIIGTEIGVESVDLCLARLIPVVDEMNGILLITADHGNADEMLEKTKDGSKKAKTSHTLNPVPFIIYDSKCSYKIKAGEFGLANVAATLCKTMNLEAPKGWEESIIE